jgi:hypothetical protein
MTPATSPSHSSAAERLANAPRACAGHGDTMQGQMPDFGLPLGGSVPSVRLQRVPRPGSHHDISIADGCATGVHWHGCESWIREFLLGMWWHAAGLGSVRVRIILVTALLLDTFSSGVACSSSPATSGGGLSARAPDVPSDSGTSEERSDGPADAGAVEAGRDAYLTSNSSDALDGTIDSSTDGAPDVGAIDSSIDCTLACATGEYCALTVHGRGASQQCVTIPCMTSCSVGEVCLQFVSGLSGDAGGYSAGACQAVPGQCDSNPGCDCFSTNTCGGPAPGGGTSYYCGYKNGMWIFTCIGN